MKVFRVVREFEHGDGYGEDTEFIVVAENNEQAVKLAREKAFYYDEYGSFEPVTVYECDLNSPKVLLKYTQC
jgi:hypothetical protein